MGYIYIHNIGRHCQLRTWRTAKVVPETVFEDESEKSTAGKANRFQFWRMSDSEILNLRKGFLGVALNDMILGWPPPQKKVVFFLVPPSLGCGDPILEIAFLLVPIRTQKMLRICMQQKWLETSCEIKLYQAFPVFRILDYPAIDRKPSIRGCVSRPRHCARRCSSRSLNHQGKPGIFLEFSLEEMLTWWLLDIPPWHPRFLGGISEKNSKVWKESWRFCDFLWVNYCRDLVSLQMSSRILVKKMPSKSACCLQEGSLKQQWITLFGWAVLVEILLKEKIRLTTWDVKNRVNNVINYL